MIANSFEYHNPKSVDEAIALLSANGGDAKILAGGHSLLPAMKLGLNQPGTLINIANLADLQFIREESGQLVIGAGVTHGEIARSSVAAKVPIMVSAADMIGDVQVRNKGTLGGSIAHADPAADWPGVLMACAATITIKGTQGERQVAADDFFQGFFQTALEDGELITQISMPIDGARSAYHKFEQPASRFALVGCAVALEMKGNTVESARVAFNGVADAAFRDKGLEAALVGKPLNDATIEAAAAKAAEDVYVMSDHYASEEYRKHLAKVYARKALSSL